MTKEIKYGKSRYVDTSFKSFVNKVRWILSSIPKDITSVLCITTDVSRNTRPDFPLPPIALHEAVTITIISKLVRLAYTEL